MPKFLVGCQPYAIQYGYIDIPDEVLKTITNNDIHSISDNFIHLSPYFSDLQEYITGHLNNVNWNTPELDYRGIDFNILLCEGEEGGG